MNVWVYFKEIRGRGSKIGEIHVDYKRKESTRQTETEKIMLEIQKVEDRMAEAKQY